MISNSVFEVLVIENIWWSPLSLIFQTLLLAMQKSKVLISEVMDTAFNWQEDWGFNAIKGLVDKFFHRNIIPTDN